MLVVFQHLKKLCLCGKCCETVKGLGFKYQNITILRAFTLHCVTLKSLPGLFTWSSE